MILTTVTIIHWNICSEKSLTQIWEILNILKSFDIANLTANFLPIKSIPYQPKNGL